MRTVYLEKPALNSLRGWQAVVSTKFHSPRGDDVVTRYRLECRWVLQDESLLASLPGVRGHALHHPLDLVRIRNAVGGLCLPPAFRLLAFASSTILSSCGVLPSLRVAYWLAPDRVRVATFRMCETRVGWVSSLLRGLVSPLSLAMIFSQPKGRFGHLP